MFAAEPRRPQPPRRVELQKRPRLAENSTRTAATAAQVRTAVESEYVSPLVRSIQLYVLLAATASAAGSTITGTLNSTPMHSFRIEFFSNAGAEKAGHAEGQTFLGCVNVPTESIH